MFPFFKIHNNLQIKDILVHQKQNIDSTEKILFFKLFSKCYAYITVDGIKYNRGGVLNIKEKTNAVISRDICVMFFFYWGGGGVFPWIWKTFSTFFRV